MRLDGLDLNLLVALDALLDERNVSAAGSRVFLSQSAMSGVLKRLRDYFDDQLLVPVGRTLMLTARAEELRQPIKNALELIRATVTVPPAFDPAVDARHFRIVASDYIFDVLLAQAFNKIAEEAPNLTFEFAFPEADVNQQLDRGEVDLLITLDTFLTRDQPSEFLFEDDHVVVTWEDNKAITHDMTKDLYLSLPHVTARFGGSRNPAFVEHFLDKQNIERNVVFIVASLSSLPQLLIGSNRVATMLRRHAEFYCNRLPLSIYPMPIDVPNVREIMQWNRFRGKDSALSWLVQRIKRFEVERHDG